MRTTARQMPMERVRGGRATRRSFVVAWVWLVGLAFVAVGLAQLLPQLAPLPAHDLEERLLQLTNEERAGAGVPALRPSATLAQAARHHAEEIVRLAYVSHVSPTPGRADVDDRVALVGGSTVSVGENLAAVIAGGVDLPERVMAGWMQSDGHRRNVLMPR